MEPQERIPEEKLCLNCEAILPENAKFCPACGQKNSDGRIKFIHLIGDFFSHFFNLDYTIFPTLRDLLVPGKLTRQYFMGRHKKYVSPLRIFLLATIFLIAALSFVIQFNNFEMEEIKEARAARLQMEFVADFDTAAVKVMQTFKGGNVKKSIDSLRSKIPIINNIRARKDSIKINSIVKIEGEGIDVIISADDFENLSPKEVAEKYEVGDFWKQMLLQQSIKFMKDPRSFFRYSIGKVLWLGFFMMPILALLYKLLYVRRNFYYVEHLVFGYHVHTFVFILTGLYLFISKQISPAFSSIPIIIIAIYIFLSMKRFYRQGILKTFIKYWIAVFAYFFIFTLSSVLIFIVSFFIF